MITLKTIRAISCRLHDIADILIAGAYWDPQGTSTVYLSGYIKARFQNKSRLVILPAISKVPFHQPKRLPPSMTLFMITIQVEDKIEEPLTDEGNLTVMSIDNLPGELTQRCQL